MTNWERIKQYLLSDECKNVHKMIWEDHAWLTTAQRKRYKITPDIHILKVIEFVRTEFKDQINEDDKEKS